ncbi:MAG: pilus assembly protein TadA [Candidatus Omnitrophica bacterium CG11_big_fil_rev_8_21_14_0_20_42_13]|uniref:Pilus assembly protein TadA n=1 Tax=Candidatus Ghiorseimicrobium undicola TaxID=1974746 RepID=A0A2H0LZM8_9BACT|nr:MAG: pilus assembly protein TadA [Candidatus Omnitrophica bacterium CG11_big_fil_rev_8_21_14_0_20_42_13]
MKPPAKTIVIFSTKGGTGRTFFATNLAVALAQDKNKKIALVDLDLEAAGDMCRYINISTANAVVELASFKPEERQKKKIKEYLKNHAPSGVDFLPIILKPTQAIYVDQTLIDKIFNELKFEYDYIVVDGGRTFTDTLVAGLNHANLILVMTTPDILAIYQAKWAIEMLQSLHYPLKMIRAVLNRADSMGGVPFQEVKLVLPCELVCRIPSEGRAVGMSLNRRMPLVLDSPRARASLAIQRLGERLVNDKNLFLDFISIAPAELPQKVSPAGMDTAAQSEFLGKYGLHDPLASSSVLISDEVIDLKRRVHQRLINELDLKRMEVDLMDPDKAAELKKKTTKAIVNALAKESGALVATSQMRERLIKELMDEALGLGPLEELMADAAVTDIMVNNKDEVYAERFGKLVKTNKKFISNDQVRQVIERIIAPLGRRIDESVPMVDARLMDGSRVNAIIPPLSLSGPMLTIRKFARERYEVSDLIKFGTLDQDMADFIRASVIMRKNMIVSGGTGSGKTTVLNVLSSFIPTDERIITIEDAAELKLHQEHWARLESRPPNIEGKGAVTIRDLFRNTLRMRPDRIVIGECRGAESLDMLQAMNTGHDGSMTTIHANSSRDVLARLDSLILMSGAELPVRAIREMIASAVDIIIHSARLSDGARKITCISEITGMIDENHIGLNDIFIYEQTGLDENHKVIGEFKPTGYIPSYYDQLIIRGINLSKEIFTPKK